MDQKKGVNNLADVYQQDVNYGGLLNKCTHLKAQTLHVFYDNCETLPALIVQKNNFGQLEFCVSQCWNYTQGAHEHDGDMGTLIFQTETNKEWSS